MSLKQVFGKYVENGAVLILNFPPRNKKMWPLNGSSSVFTVRRLISDTLLKEYLVSTLYDIKKTKFEDILEKSGKVHLWFYNYFLCIFLSSRENLNQKILQNLVAVRVKKNTFPF